MSFNKKSGMKKRHRIDGQIRVTTVDLIDQDGTYHKNVATSSAMQMAADAGLSLVEIRPQSIPPMCKIMDYGKFCYEETKKASATRKKQREVTTKEFRISPNIGQNDLNIKIKHARQAIEEGHKVRITMVYVRREIMHAEIGMEVMKKFIHSIEDISKVFEEPKLMGKRCICVVQPK